jgi:dTDP-4-dehydrorhamnose 3,5-epimerase
MIFTETKLKGAFILDIEPHEDHRGFFARTFCAREFIEHGLTPAVVQCSLSFNRLRGTVRGMHYQEPPHAEAKLVRCTHGGIYDVIIDLRPGSPTYLEHIGIELTAQNRRALYVPELFAHGFQTLADDTEVCYQMSQFYAPSHARGLRYNDPALGLVWPLPVTLVSSADSGWPLLSAGAVSSPAESP